MTRPRPTRALAHTPPVARFGPTSEILQRFYAGLAGFTPEMWREAGERWIALEPPQYGRADRIATGLIDGLERNGAWVAARVELEQVLDQQRQQLRRTRPDQLLPAGLGFNAAQCAIVALLVQDQIPADILGVLYCPFEPMLPLASILGAAGGPSPVLDLTARLRASKKE